MSGHDVLDWFTPCPLESDACPPIRCSVDPADIADALAYALRYGGNRRVHHADGTMARITAESLSRHLARAGFVRMREELSAALTTSHMPISIG